MRNLTCLPTLNLPVRRPGTPIAARSATVPASGMNLGPDGPRDQVEKPACEHTVNLYSTFAPFSQRGLPSGTVETCCDRCGETTLSGLPGRDSLLDLVVWARDHKCPPPAAQITRAGVGV